MKFETVKGLGSEKHPLTKEDKKKNRQLSSDQVLNENVIGSLKRFKILSDRYRNRRKRFSKFLGHNHGRLLQKYIKKRLPVSQQNQNRET